MIQRPLPLRWLTCSLWMVVVLIATNTFAASPRLTIIQPRGFQRGTEHVFSFNGTNLADAAEVFFYSPGLEVIELAAEAKSVKVKVKIAADCRLGEHAAQVRTKSGISDFRTFQVEALPAIAEKEPNTDIATPQAISQNVVVNGTIGNEDVDYYVVEAKKGQRISAEVVAMRLSSALFDPYVAILDAKRFELSSNDDTPLAVQDAFASIIAPADGKYTIEVRESAYGQGNIYRLHVGNFPRPTAVFPAGGKLGEDVDVNFLGDPTGVLAKKIKLPTTPDEEFGLFATDAGGIAPTPNRFRLFEHGNAFEIEPNNKTSEATPVALPLAFNGIIETEGDMDYFRFTAKKGQVFDVECFARRIRSGLDPVMNIFDGKGKSILGSDDSRGNPDSYVRFPVPADGEYLVRVRDHLKRGAPDFVYRIEFHPVKPRLTVSIPRIERYGQYRQQIYVARGNRFGTLINVARNDFGGDLVLDGKDLPAGMTMHAETMPASLSSIPVVFEAAADAPLAGKLLDFRARHADPKQNIQGGFFNRVDFIVANPGQSRYRGKDVYRLPIAVVDELPFRIEIIEPKVPLVREGQMKLKIVVHKKEGWDEQVNIQFPFRPPGVGATTSINIPKGKTEGLYPLNASAAAQVKKWKVFALASSGGMWASSQLANLEVADAFVKFELQRASCEQGEEAQLYCKLNHATQFEGTATASILGLPAKVTTTQLEFNKETKELTFNLKTDPASPVGKHSLICRITINQNGEPIVGRAGGVQLQIDKPLPKATPKAAPPKPQPAKVAAKPEPKKPVAKPLSRLEKLRLAAQKRRDEQAAGGSE